MQYSWVNQQFKRIAVKKFLKHRGISHRIFTSIKHHGKLYLNHHRIVTSQPMKLGDEVAVDIPSEPADPHVVISHGKLDVVYEDQNWLVINKPAGLTSVPGPHNRHDTVVNRLKGYLLAHHSPNLRPHLITRLDMYTSGLMLIAKHRFANSLANQLINTHKIKKVYLAIIKGHLKTQHGSVKMLIGKLPNEIKRHKMINGQFAWTEYRQVKSYPKFTLIKARLHTGRAHQIRVHFTEIGHPLVGDHLYGGPMDWGIKRQALHAWYLAFPDPFTHQVRKFKANLPADMKRLLTQK